MQENQLIPVTSHRRPLIPEGRLTWAQPGNTPNEVIAGLYPDEGLRACASVMIDGKPVAGEWLDRELSSGQVMAVALIPQNGNGSDALRNVLNIVLVLGGAFASNAIGGPLGWGVGVALYAATWLVNQLIPASEVQDLAELGYSTSGVQNKVSQWETIPKIYGRHKVIPPLGAQYYTETLGDEIYLRALFVVGFGPLQIESVKLGDQLVIDDVTGDPLYEDMEMEIRQGLDDDPPITLVTQDIGQESIGDLIEYDPTTPLIYTTETDTDEISLDIEFPGGLCNDDDGDLNGWSVDFKISYRPYGFGEDAWLQVDESIAAILSDISAIQTIAGRIEYLTVIQAELAAQVAVLTGIALPDRIVTDEISTTMLERIQVWTDALTTMNDEGDATLASEIADTLTQLLSFQTVFGTFVIGPAGSMLIAVLEAMDAIALVVNFVVELQRVNNYIAQGTGPDLSTLPWWAQLLIRRRGLAVLFSEPALDSTRITASKLSIVRRGYRWKVETGKYDVKVERTSAPVDEDDDDLTGVHEDPYWTTLRSIHYREAIATDLLPPIAKIAMRVKIGDQFNGVLDNLNCIATSMLSVPTPDGSGGYTYAVEATRNHAWCLVDCLTGSYRPRPVDIARLEMDDIYAWGVACDAETFVEDGGDTKTGRTFDLVISKATTADKMARVICASGKASFSTRGGRFGVTQDIEQTVPVAFFSPANSWGFSGQKSHAAQPHALRISYIDAGSDYVQAERFVYADGYAAVAAGTDAAATRFESLMLPGATDARQIWADARYYLACSILRPRVFSWSCDLTWTTIPRGALVRRTDDIMLWGQAYGRIAKTVTDAGTTTLTLDNRITLLAASTYELIAIYSDTYGYKVTLDAVASDVSTNVVTFTGSWPTSPASDVSPGGATVSGGESFMLGVEDSVTTDLIVTSIESDGLKQATITAIDAAPGVHRDPADPIPPFDPDLDIPPVLELPIPPAPTIRTYPSGHPDAGEQMILSDEQVLILGLDGTLRPRIVVYIDQPEVPPGRERPASVQKQIRRIADSVTAGDTENLNPWVNLSSVESTAGELAFLDVEETKKYDLRFRNVAVNGLASAWVLIESHTVIGKTSPPPDVATLTLDSSYVLHWTYPNSPRDFSHFEIRYIPLAVTSPAWADGYALGQTPAFQYDASAFAQASISFMIKGVDTSGNYSVNAANLIANITPGAPRNVIVTQDYDPTFDDADILTLGGEVEDSKLKALFDSTDLFWGGDGEPFWGDDADLFWNYAWTGPSMLWEYTAPAGTSGSDLYLEWTVENTTGLQVWYAKDVDASTLTIPDDLTPMPARITVIEGSTYLFYVQAMPVDPGDPRPAIITLSVNIDVPDIVERFQDLEITVAADGIRLPIERDYTKIQGIGGLTLQDDGGSAAYLEVVDKGYPTATNPTDGPLIKARTGAGVLTTASFDAECWGY